MPDLIINHNLRPAKCCRNCLHSTKDRDIATQCWCEHKDGPAGIVSITAVCDLHKIKKVK